MRATGPLWPRNSSMVVSRRYDTARARPNSLYHTPMWPEPEQTRDLLERAKAGDSAAVNDLLERHREVLNRAIALRLDPALARRVDASDIVQDVLLEANQRLRAYLKNP